MQISEQKLRAIVRKELQTQLQLNEIDIKSFGNKIANAFKTIKDKIMPDKPTGPEYALIEEIKKELSALISSEGKNETINTITSILNNLALQKDGKYIYGDSKNFNNANLIIKELLKLVDDVQKAQKELLKIVKQQQTSDIGIQGYGADDDEEEQPQNENKSNSYNMIFENWRNYQELINEKNKRFRDKKARLTSPPTTPATPEAVASPTNPLQPLNIKINKIYNVVNQEVSRRVNVDKSNVKEYQLLNINYLLKIIFERVINPLFFELQMTNNVKAQIKTLLEKTLKFIELISKPQSPASTGLSTPNTPEAAPPAPAA